MSDSRSGENPSSQATDPEGDQSKNFWEFADVGFDTGKRLWFIQFYNEKNEGAGTYFARSISLKNGNASQYQWKDAEGRAFWHVRERFFADQIESFSIDSTGFSISITFKRDKRPNGGNSSIPLDFEYLLYAFHLTNKDGGRAPMSFVEFYDSKGKLNKRLDNRWIIIEGASRSTFGVYPKISLRIDRANIEGITVTNSAVIISGNQ